MRPNATVGWVPRESLYGLHLVETRLVVDKRKLRAVLYRRGTRVWSARVGVGKAGTPTPAGHFWIRDRLRPSGSGGIYGPLAFGTSACSVLSDWPGGGVIGIHGTNEPGLIPGRPSPGCIRVRNAAILRLGRLMPLGTPVLIR
jgi:lipoprotein-anchoring transpeptidase ErfK/SrfK